MTWWEWVLWALITGGNIALLVKGGRVLDRARAMEVESLRRLAEAKGIQDTLRAFYGESKR
jgi:hypothetical protein